MFITYSCSFSCYENVFNALELVVESIDVTSLAWSNQKSPVCACTYIIGPSIELILGIKLRLSLISIDCWKGLRSLEFPPISPWSGAYGLYVSCICITIIYTFIVRLVPVLPALNYTCATCMYFWFQCYVNYFCAPCMCGFQCSIHLFFIKNNQPF